MPESDQPAEPLIDRGHLQELEDLHRSIGAELIALNQRELAINTERAVAETHVTTAPSGDLVRAAQSMIRRLDDELQAIQNRRPRAEGERRRLVVELESARREADRRGSAEVIVALEPIARKMLSVLDEFDAKRRSMIEAGAPAFVAPWRSGEPGNADRQTQASLLVVDRFRAWLESTLLGSVMSDARDGLEGVERQRFSVIPASDDALAAAYQRSTPKS